MKNVNRLEVVSTFRDQLDENGNAVHLHIRDGQTEEMVYVISTRPQAREILFGRDRGARTHL